MDHMDYERVVDDIMATGAEVVFNTIVPPGLTPFLEQLHRAGFTARGGTIVCTYFDENFLNLVPAEHVEGLYGCLDYYRGVDDAFSIELLNRYEGLFPGSAQFTAGSACTGTYRALKFWEAAVNEAGLAEPGRHHHGIGPRPDRAGPGRPGRDGAGPAPRAHEHVHRPIRGRHVQRGEEPGPHRPQGVRGRTALTAHGAPVRCRTGAPPAAAEYRARIGGEATMDEMHAARLELLEYGLRTLREQVVALPDAQMDVVSELRAVDGAPARQPRAEQPAAVGRSRHRRAARVARGDDGRGRLRRRPRALRGRRARPRAGDVAH